MPNLDSRPQTAAGVLGRDLTDEYLFYDPNTEQVHVLNATAREIYLLCNGRTSVLEIARALVERYGVDEALARRDVERTVDRLIELGLVGTN